MCLDNRETAHISFVAYRMANIVDNIYKESIGLHSRLVLAKANGHTGVSRRLS